MYLMYVDDSGSPTDSSQRYFVLGGFAVFERQVHWISLEMDKIAARFDTVNPASVELHGSPMVNGRDLWRGFPLPMRIEAVKDALRMFAASHASSSAFCVAVEKSSVTPEDPVEWAFEELCRRFDEFLKRIYRQGGNGHRQGAHRGMMVFDESTKRETRIQQLATDFRTTGHKSGIMRNLAEVPLFVDSRATRLVQLADLIAYSVFRSVERNDDQFVSLFWNRFDVVSGVRNGLCVKR